MRPWVRRANRKSGPFAERDALGRPDPARSRASKMSSSSSPSPRRRRRPPYESMLPLGSDRDRNSEKRTIPLFRSFALGSVDNEEAAGKRPSTSCPFTQRENPTSAYACARCIHVPPCDFYYGQTWGAKREVSNYRGRIYLRSRGRLSLPLQVTLSPRSFNIRGTQDSARYDSSRPSRLLVSCSFARESKDPLAFRRCRLIARPVTRSLPRTVFAFSLFAEA